MMLERGSVELLRRTLAMVDHQCYSPKWTMLVADIINHLHNLDCGHDLLGDTEHSPYTDEHCAAAEGLSILGRERSKCQD